MHNGTDASASHGTPLYGPGVGATVLRVGVRGGYGLTVEVRTSGGQELLYGHLSRSYVFAGQSIGYAMPIGLVGQSGLASGPHVHWELRSANDSLMNPQSCDLWSP